MGTPAVPVLPMQRGEEQVEDKRRGKDRPKTDSGSPNDVAEVMHPGTDHPQGDSACHQECGAGKGKPQPARHPREKHCQRSGQGDHAGDVSAREWVAPGGPADERLE
jgi:hypothetical protein